MKLRKNATFTMNQYLRGVLGAEGDVRCPDKLWTFGESLEEDGSRLIWFDEAEFDGDTYHGKYRIKKYKVPKITRKRKATTEDDVKVPLAQTPTGLFKNATSS